jgi:hypothetical protein
MKKEEIANLGAAELMTRLETTRAELAMITEEVETRRSEEQKRLGRLVAEHIDVFLALRPNHDRSSCSDDDTCNSRERAGRVRCVRCQLLQARADGALAPEMSLEFTIVDPMPR